MSRDTNAAAPAAHPTLKTLPAILDAAGLRLAVSHPAGRGGTPGLMTPQVSDM